MGTHPSGPAKLWGSTVNLSDWIRSHPGCVGLVPPGYPVDDLPFLFKVLSVETALSIQVRNESHFIIYRFDYDLRDVQAHPNKELAQQLHSQYPTVYKDGNHKPEMTIALTDFECLCGFRSAAEIAANLVLYPEFKVLLGETGESVGFVFCASLTPPPCEQRIQTLQPPTATVGKTP